MTVGAALGIDLGTSNTVAMVRSGDGRVRPVLFDGQPLLPSGVYAEGSGRLLVGRDALHMARLEPDRFEPHPKRRIDEGTVLLGGAEWPVVDLLAAILRRVTEEAAGLIGGAPTRAVLTYPARWGGVRRAALLRAATDAGLTELGLVAEPVAAAWYYASVLGQRVPVGRPLLVFDLGGGTFDVAVVRREPEGFAVAGTGGLDDLGGVDADAAIVTHLGDLVSAREPDLWQRLANPADTESMRTRRLLWDDVRTAKEMLSRTTSAAVHVPGYAHGLHLTREEFERLVRPLLARAVDESARVVAECGHAPGELAGVFLVGGASRIPLAGALLHERLGVAPTTIEQPELAVAEGAIHVDDGRPAAEPMRSERPIRPVRPAWSPPPGAPSTRPVSSPPGAPTSPVGHPTSPLGPPRSQSAHPTSAPPGNPTSPFTQPVWPPWAGPAPRRPDGTASDTSDIGRGDATATADMPGGFAGNTPPITVRFSPRRATTTRVWRAQILAMVGVFVVVMILALTVGTTLIRSWFDIGRSAGATTGTGTGAGSGSQLGSDGTSPSSSPSVKPKPSLSPNAENSRGDMHVVLRDNAVLPVATPWEKYVDGCHAGWIADPLLKNRVTDGHFAECHIANSGLVAFQVMFYRFNSRADQEAYRKDLGAKWKQCEDLTDTRVSRSGVRCLGKGDDPESSSPAWIYWDDETEPVGARLIGYSETNAADLNVIWDTYA